MNGTWWGPFGGPLKQENCQFRSWQVLVMLVSAMFACPGLDWNSPQDSVELFAGDCSITRGEWKDYKAQHFGLKTFSGPSN